MPNTIPTLDQIQALDGRIFAMLSDDELAVLDFYRAQGRKFNVAVSLANTADPAELLRARSQAQVDEILKQANSVVNVTIGAEASAAWVERVWVAPGAGTSMPLSS